MELINLILCWAFSWICAILVTFLSLIICYPLARYIRLKCFAGRVEASWKKGILITGATSGIGLLLAKHFHKLGFTIFATYYNDREPGYAELSKLISEEKKKRPRMFLVNMDVRSQASIRQARQELDEAMDEHGIELYCLINNAGLGKGAPFEWDLMDSMKDVIDTNLLGMMWVTREFMFRLIQSRGRVVNTSSGLGLLPTYGMSTYGTTKAAVIYLTESLQLDLQRYGVSSYCVLPGNFIDKSNIIFSRLKSLEDAKKKLSADEATKYQESIEDQFKLVHNYIRNRLTLEADGGEEWRQFASIHNINLDVPEISTSLQESGKRGLVMSILEMISGSANSLDEDCGILEAFKQTICLERPPNRAYAGNWFYTNLTGPIMELVPPLARKLTAQLTGVYLTRAT